MSSSVQTWNPSERFRFGRFTPAVGSKLTRFASSAQPKRPRTVLMKFFAWDGVFALRSRPATIDARVIWDKG
ncbi:hypothetical protein J2S34_000643 [Nitrobacter winogradskyi]|uniref:Uncharacterized protein n=1 Tax=Nitrobacter winogradskyi TaxID=913 RepID=A0ACC6AG15_NITWI|nr:hypothetical protein [Nitrobacter winogradskyi]